MSVSGTNDHCLDPNPDLHFQNLNVVYDDDGDDDGHGDLCGHDDDGDDDISEDVLEVGEVVEEENS